MSDAFLQRSRCRVCQSPLALILSLGDLYPVAFPQGPSLPDHPQVPLQLVGCTNPDCTLVQLGHTTPREWLYTQYWYRSGVNEAMRAELQDVVAQALRRVSVAKGDVVVDIGANDGTLLACYPHAAPGVVTVAYEPAHNLYEALRPHAQVVYPTYFGEGTASVPPAAKAKILTAIAMFYDLDDPVSFCQALQRFLHPDGVCVIQQAYLPAMLAQTGYDNIVHEHLEYYDLHALEYVLGLAGLEVFDVELRQINGGSFRAYVQHKGRRPVGQRVWDRRTEEHFLWGHWDAVYESFARRVGDHRRQLQALLEMYAQAGQAVDLYAASTKANTLLQFCGITSMWVRQAWERSPEKVGRYVGQTGIPIVSEETGRADPPHALLCGAWQFKDAFVAREAEYLAQGGRLVFPLPYLDVVEQAVTP